MSSKNVNDKSNGATSTNTSVKLKPTQLDGDERIAQEALYRKQIELEIRSELLHADMESETRKLNEPNKFSQLISQADSIGEDIDDYIDDYPVYELANSVDDLDHAVDKVERMRSEFRTVHKEIRIFYGERRYQQDFINGYKSKLDTIREYLSNVRDKRKLLREDQDRLRMDQEFAHAKKLRFLGTEVRRIISHLTNKFDIDLADEEDDEIKKRKEELNNDSNSLMVIPKKIEELMTAGEADREIENIKKLYDDLLESKDTYVFELEREYKDREIEKQNNFIQSKLGIKLPEFCGFDSKLDIYTFQDQFEKFYIKTMPQSTLPDLLKNNYLTGSA